MPSAKVEPRRAERVLLLVTQADWGGVQSFLVRFAEALVRDGRTVLLAAGGEGELWSEAERRGIPTRRLAHVRRDISPFEDCRAVGELKRLMREFRPDAVHLNSSKMGVLGSIAAAKLGRQRPWTVYRIGGWAFLEPVSSWKKAAYRAAERWSASKKDVIITVHPGDERIARDFHIRPRHALVTVPNGLDDVAFAANLLPRSEARRALGIPEHAFVFGTVANAYATKGLLPYLDVLTNALAEDRNAVGVILGDGPELDAVRNKRDASPAKDRIVLTGHRDDASRLYAAFDAFVLPSRKEGMPWTVLEAMASGVPVIATDVGACRWMLTENEGGDAGVVVPKDDPLSLLDAMHGLRTHPEEREAFGRAGRTAVSRRFAWTETVKGNLAALDRTSADG